MGYDSKGIVLRVQSTVSSRASVVITTGFTFAAAARTITTTAGIWSTVAGGDGYKTGLRLYFTNATLNTGCYTIRGFTSSRVITVYEPLVDQAAATSAKCIGHEFEEIGEVVSFSGPSGAVPVIDMTHLGSSYKEKRVGTPDEGQVTFEVIRLYPVATSMQPRLIADRQSRTKRYFDVKLNDTAANSSSQPTAFNFEGYVASYVPSAAVDAALRAAVTLEITGDVSWMQKYAGNEL